MPASPTDCIFCKIAMSEIPVEFLVESEHAVAFLDQQPMATEHVLVIPRQHLSSINDLSSASSTLLTDLFATARKVAEIRGIVESGYRVVTNAGSDAGQTIFHLHFHILGGEPLGAFGRQESQHDG
ncbi:MAG: histidine triad nucleotide-binding protein [Thermomicrobiales bacterium]